MPNTLQLTLELQGVGALSDAPGGINPTSETFLIGILSSMFPGDTILPVLSLVTGTGDGQGNQWYSGQRTLAATTYDLLNIRDVTAGLVNGLGQPIQLSKVKGFLIVVNSHDGTKVLQVGPQNQTHAWQGPFSGVGAGAYIDVPWICFLACDKGNGIGTVVDSTHNILPIYNPGGSSVTYSVFIVGNE